MRLKTNAHLARAARTALIDSLESRLLFATVPSGFADSLLVEGLVSPTAMEFAPDGRLFVLEKNGAVRIVKDGALLPNAFVNVQVSTAGERGLGGIAFDPNFQTNKYVYLYYTAESPSPHNVITRFTASGDAAIAGSQQLIFELPPMGSGTIHNGGAMAFAPDGTLMVGVGDHSNAANAQSMTVPFGKVLRINPDGSIPSDNPFLNSTSGVTRAIWALGLRNPFTMSIQQGTGRLFINDVGAADWEEINEGVAGANYGWSTTEGPFNPAQYPDFANPIHAYDHSEGYAVTGGAFYNPQVVQFPAEMVGQYFFADYVTGFVRRLNPDTRQVTPFATGFQGVVDLDVGPDGSLYVLSRWTNSVFKVSATSAPAVSSQPASQLISVGQPVTFSVVASGALPLSYQWQRGGIDIPGANTSSYTIEAAAMDDSGATFRCVITNASGSTMTNPATLTVTTDQPPTPVILTPTTGTTYGGGQNISFSGEASDPEEGMLPASAMTWWVDFHHNTHTHPFLPPSSGVTSSEFEVPVLGETASNVWYRIHLSVTDSAGFTRTTYRDVMPRVSTVTFGSNQSGLTVVVDGQPRTMPFTFSGVAGMHRTISVAPLQTVGGVQQEFLGWSQGGAATQLLVFPEDDTTYTATYEPFTDYYLSDRTWTSKVGTVRTDTNAFGYPITLDGVVFPKGLGMQANTQVTYDLGGAFERFISEIGRDDAWGDLGSVTFQVWVDGVKRYESEVMTGATPRQTIDVDVTGANELRLVVTDGGDGPGYDEANWANARLRVTDAAPPDAPVELAVVSPIYNRVNLAWKDRSSNEAGFVIERSLDGIDFTPIGTVGAGVTSYIDGYRAGGTTYHYRVSATNVVGQSSYTSVVSVTTAPATLPSPWLETDVGAIPVNMSGNAQFADGSFTVRGSGVDIGYESDEFHFVYQPLTGDGRLIARVNSIGSSHEAAKAGVMMRETLAGASRSALMYLSPQSNAGFMRRTVTGGDSDLVYLPQMATPRWVQLVRQGDLFTASYSDDGVNWTTAGSTTIAMGTTIYAGLAVTSAQAQRLNPATFDQVALNNSAPVVVTPPAATPSPVTGTTAALSVVADDDGGEAALTYTWTTAAKPLGAADVAFSINGTNAARETTATFGKAGTYTVRARIFDGLLAVTSDVTVVVDQTLTSIVVSSASTAPLPAGAERTFIAQAKDQFGEVLVAQPTFAWTASGGSITADGVLTAPATQGTVTVTASAGGGTITGSTTVDVVNAPPAVVEQPTAVMNANGLTAALAVLGGSGAGEAELTYTWSLTAQPAGAVVVFSANGTNAAKSAVASFDRTGSYELLVTISDGTASTTASVEVNVAQVVSSVSVSPATVLLAPAQTQQWTAAALDQFGQPMETEPSYEWSVSGGGTIDTAGLFTAGEETGTFTVSASTTGGISGQAQVVVDGAGPVAAFENDAFPTAGDVDWTFRVTYTDLSGVSVVSLGDDDIVFTAPSGAEYFAQFLSVDQSTDGAARTATYRLVPDGGFGAAESGLWTMSVNALGVFDIHGNSTPAAALTTFTITASFAAISPEGALRVSGTAGNDTIFIGMLDGRIDVTLNGQSESFDADDVTSLLIATSGGNDTVSLTDLSTTLTYLGGSGADTINVASGIIELLNDAGGATLNIGANGSVAFRATQHLAQLNLSGGVASIASTGVALVTSTLTMTQDSMLDLGTGALVVKSGELGAWNQTTYTGLTGLLDPVLNEGTWNSTGITSAAAAGSDGRTLLGIALAGDVLWLAEGETELWQGVTVGHDSVLIRYTYAGDANLDGALDADDYSHIDVNWRKGGSNGYSRGDFNYDGRIDADDYSIIDVNYRRQNPPLNRQA